MPTLKQHIHSEAMPVGDAIARLIRVQYSLLSIPAGVTNQRLAQERAALVEALNRLTVDLKFSCELPDHSTLLADAKAAPEATTVEIIRRGAGTDCCRIVPTEKPRSASRSR